ncbi:hypothetical protein J6S35_00630 [Candidatus Saccharibacteria bacterium]|nr:hypothetical protein [Candidatus Saccharibacteria bacterium]
MAWSDGPTKAQVNALWRLMQWALLPNDVLNEAVAWLEKRVNRKQMSQELGRVRALQIDRKLDKISCFDSPIWDGFEHKGRYKRKAEEARREILRKFKG